MHGTLKREKSEKLKGSLSFLALNLCDSFFAGLDLVPAEFVVGGFYFRPPFTLVCVSTARRERALLTCDGY